MKKLYLLEALTKLFPNSSKRTLKNWIKYQRVSVDNQVVTSAHDPVSIDSVITLDKKKMMEKPNLSFLYEDEHLIIIDKPAGLLSVPLDQEKSKNVLKMLREYYNSSSIFAVHRIDKATSGVLVFAKTSEAREGMDALFRQHNLIREYLALVEGSVKDESGSWKSYLYEKTHFEVKATTPEYGKHAITHFTVLRKTKKCTWLKLQLETGRKHQIRVHCTDAGHPVVGDKRYGSSLNPYKRLCLHAHRIAFTHPITKEKIDVSAQPVSFTKNFSL